MDKEHEEIRALLIQAKERLREILESLSEDIRESDKDGYEMSWESPNFRLELKGVRK